MDESSGGGWDIGSTIADVAREYFSFRTATSGAAVRWLPGQTNGVAVGVGPDGSVYQRGTPAAGPVASTLAPVLIVGLALVAGFLVYRALK
jgi:hypothetical protein